MTLLSDLFLDKTQSGDISNYHVYTGKKAWSQGVEITGVNDPITPGLIFHYEFPKAAGAFTPAIADYRKGVLHPSVSISGGGQLENNANGYVYSGTTFRLIANCSTLPAKTATYRRYTLWGMSGSSISTNTRVRIRFNAQDASNYWELYLEWDGTNWKLKLSEVVAATPTERSSVPTIAAAVTNPAHFGLWVEDQGDTVNYGCWVRDESSPPDTDAIAEKYNVASRNFKSSESAQFGFWSIAGDQILLKGCSIQDR